MPRCLPFASLLLLSGLLPAHAQQPPPDTFAMRVEVRLVEVEVAVTDPAGHFLADLKRQNFRVREDGVPQTLAHFAPTRAPVRIVVLVEASPAVFLIQTEHLAAAYHLLRGLREEDQVALLSYARDTRQELDFTTDKHLAEQRLASLGRFGLGIAEMNLLDAVAYTLAWLPPTHQRTAVLVIGTGLDTGSQIAWEELRQRLGASQVTFFTVATGRLLRGEPERKKKRRGRQEPAAELDLDFAEADARLRALAEASAGQAYFPQSAKDLDAIYGEIAERLRNLYSLGYYPTNPARDGSYRAIRVELVDEGGAPLTLHDPAGKPIAYRVFARPGYFAPRQ